MTTKPGVSIGASSALSGAWDNIPWKQIQRNVHRLQMRIAKAAQQNRYNKVRALQRLVTRSYSAKMLAVKRVTTSRGAQTAGIDRVLWSTARAKEKAVNTLKQRGYKPKPLRRIYIPKKGSARRQRPLSIPTMKDRAMQALYWLALEPVSEVQADPNAYGFRPQRSTADAIEQCFKVLAQKQAASWVLEGDIKACFSEISHSWLLNNIPMDKQILRKWLKAGYMENQVFHKTEKGTAQGGVISPTLLIMALSGLEKAIVRALPKRDKAHVITYADDFIITGASKEIIEEKVIPVVKQFLKERGLELSPDKTRITPIEKGFSFLGFHIRKYQDKLRITPAKENIKGFLKKIRSTFKAVPSVETSMLIHLLNPKIRGWANYYSTIRAKRAMSKVDHHIFRALIRWIKKRHPTKSAKWWRAKYFHKQGSRDWVLFTKIKNSQGEAKILEMALASNTPSVKHVKIKATAHPYDQTYREYFNQRKAKRHRIQWNRSYAAGF